MFGTVFPASGLSELPLQFSISLVAIPVVLPNGSLTIDMVQRLRSLSITVTKEVGS